MCACELFYSLEDQPTQANKSNLTYEFHCAREDAAPGYTASRAFSMACWMQGGMVAHVFLATSSSLRAVAAPANSRPLTLENV